MSKYQHSIHCAVDTSANQLAFTTQLSALHVICDKYTRPAFKHARTAMSMLCSLLSQSRSIERNIHCACMYIMYMVHAPDIELQAMFCNKKFAFACNHASDKANRTTLCSYTTYGSSTSALSYTANFQMLHELSCTALSLLEQLFIYKCAPTSTARAAHAPQYCNHTHLSTLVLQQCASLIVRCL